MENKTYLCIDLKSFYASVECAERGLDPMSTNLVVADPERSDKTICLAVSPAMKALGVKNRCRVFEIPKTIEYITAPPRMQKYIDYAAEIYSIYLRYVSKDDIHVYSIDEVFIDASRYLKLYEKAPKDFAIMLMGMVKEELGITAACGIGTNMYLAKIALDISAKHTSDNIAYLDEKLYRETLWDHRPLTDFWRIGKGTARRLEQKGIYTMSGVAYASEDMLYKLFGIDAELLIDHAWGREPTTIADIKAYKPKSNCITSGQVLMRDYSFGEGCTIIKEMADSMCLELAEKNMVTRSITVMVGYSNSEHIEPAKGSVSFENETCADSVIIPAAVSLYERIVDRSKYVRRMNISFNNIVPDSGIKQMNFFDSEEDKCSERSRKIQKTVLDIKRRFGKDAVLRGISLTEEATARERNHQIGGHKSGE
ncbi:MAG: DNA repair protein [Ruminococcaceae bacterium]|nr:DNA repair protein [Oscillospiraceae bacterium]